MRITNIIRIMRSRSALVPFTGLEFRFPEKKILAILKS
jgi:hypothetical protein